MSELRELAITMASDLRHIKEWVNHHDCAHKEMKGSIRTLERFMWSLGALTPLILLVAKLIGKW